MPQEFDWPFRMKNQMMALQLLQQEFDWPLQKQSYLVLLLELGMWMVSLVQLSQKKMKILLSNPVQGL